LAVLPMTRVLTEAPVLVIPWRQRTRRWPADHHRGGSCGGADAGH
jgi:hypothetical protein